jgi:selenide,water dikinase
MRHNEDAAIVRVPSGRALVQTVDFLTPIVNDPYMFGKIAAANALSDVYAMGGVPWTAMNIACFPVCDLSAEILTAILQGGADAVAEADAVLAGGHSVRDGELKFGLAVTGLIDPALVAVNSGLRAGDALILTKALGSGILATALKARWEGCEAFEAEIVRWASRLNKNAGAVITALALGAATDVTGFGLGGHAMEMARASRLAVRLDSGALPIMRGAAELAGLGLVPQGSHANRMHAADKTRVAETVAGTTVDLVFDAQTSGGLLLAVPRDKVRDARTRLLDGGDLACVVGEVVPARDDVLLFIE